MAYNYVITSVYRIIFLKGSFDMANSFNTGNLYENGKIAELKVGIGADLKVQAIGTEGSFQVIGKLTQNGAEKILAMINTGDFSKATTITNNDIYAGDVSGFYSISVKNVSGFTKVWANITY